MKLNAKIEILQWNGMETNKRSQAASAKAINRIMARCVEVARPLTPVRTGNLQESLRYRAARPEGDGVIAGYWGSFTVDYAIYVELGTVSRAGRYMLTRAAQKVYPEFKDILKGEWNNG